VPPISRSEKVQSPPLAGRRLRGTLAIAAGVLAGSLGTWMLARRPPSPTAPPLPAVGAATVPKPAAPAVVTPLPSTKPVEPTGELPVAVPPSAPVITSEKSRLSLPVRKTPKRAVRKPPKKPPPGWDPEGMLPP
jgi:hypothetical protein